MTAIQTAIQETIDAARELRAREDALRSAVASGNGPAIIEAARAYFGEDEHGRDRAPARVERGPGRR